MKTYHDDLPRSLLLHAAIKAKIQQHNALISFADFMELALYHPQYGYYQQPNFAIGKSGDFTTAPEISPLFAACFARQCQQIQRHLHTNNMLELGAGSGRFALDLLSKLDSLHALPDHYYIYEISPHLRQAQQKLIQEGRPDLISRIEWLTELPQTFAGIMIANELLDAIPFERFQIENQLSKQCMVGLHEDQFVWRLIEPLTHEFKTACDDIQRQYQLADGYQSELQLPAMTLVKQLCQVLTHGVILFADYGYGQREYYHPQRYQGTLTCFYQHQSNQEPLRHPGLQDITTHIDFTRTIETAAEQGAQLLGFTTQNAFLLANGLMEEAAAMEAGQDERGLFRLHQAIKTLTLPTEMGETIKIMGIGRDFDHPITGFSLVDRRRDL